MNSTNINIADFLRRFNEEYDFLYQNHDRVAGYDEALDLGDKFSDDHIEFVNKFNHYRKDVLSSDREVVAFMFAMEP